MGQKRSKFGVFYAIKYTGLKKYTTTLLVVVVVDNMMSYAFLRHIIWKLVDVEIIN